MVCGFIGEPEGGFIPGGIVCEGGNIGDCIGDPEGGIVYDGGFIPGLIGEPEGDCVCVGGVGRSGSGAN